MGIIAWIVFGLIAGVIAKLIMPGRDGGGFILTCILGIVGAVVGGWLATMFGIGGTISGFNLHSFLVAVVGAIGAGGIPACTPRLTIRLLREPCFYRHSPSIPLLIYPLK